ncbi:MAG: hypothetical protein AAFU79_10750 [Myxococcota bacterium]
MEGAVLDVMNEGLRALEPHAVLDAEPHPWTLARFEMHMLAFAEAFGRLLEKRVARDVDRDHPPLKAMARAHLRLHQPLPRMLRTQLVRLGRPYPELDSLTVGTKTQACLHRAAQALERRDPLLAHVLLVQGLECLTQLLTRRGVELAAALGGTVEPFEERHRGHESLLFLGLESLTTADEAGVVSELEALYADAFGLLDEWFEEDPSHRPSRRPRQRGERWGTGDLPDEVA